MRENNAKYLYGKKEIEVLPYEPYAASCCDFLDCLSKVIYADREAKQYPDIMTFAFWIRKANISKMREEYVLRNAQKKFGCWIGRGLVFHVAPSNVPINFAYSMVFGMLAGNSNIVKVSSRKFLQIEIICRLLESVTKQGEFRWVKNRNAIVAYDREEKCCTDYFSEICDARIIWGGDNTITQIRQSLLPPRSIEITFADRYSFAIISSQAILNASVNEIKVLAEQFYNDTYLMDQNACSSPHFILWQGNEADYRNASRRFWEELFFICKKKYDLADIKVSEKYTALCEAMAGMKDIEVYRYENMIYIIKLKNLPEGITSLKGRYGLFFENQIEDLQSLYIKMEKKVQTCAIYGIDADTIARRVLEEHVMGIDRIVPVGKTLDIGVIWDGYDVIGQLSRCIQVL